jgi:hypothetical protein
MRFVAYQYAMHIVHSTARSKKLTLDLGISGFKTSVRMVKLRSCCGCSATE